MTEADDWAAEVVDSYAREAPEVLDLAVAVSLASRVEPGLLRRARLELAPGVHAGVESELWYSPLVQHRSPKAMVFAPAVAWRLQQRLKEGERPSLTASWELLRAIHSGLPDAIRLEEEITWRAVRDAEDPEIPALLRRAVRTLIEGETPDLAQWAARALPRLPPPVRRSPDAWLLALAASSRLGGLVVLGEPMPEGLAADELFWVAAQSAAQVPVYLRRQEGALLLSLQAGDGGAPATSLAAPATHPVLLEATAGDGTPRLVALRPEEPDPVSLILGAGGLRLRTAAGEVFRVEVPLAVGPAGPAIDLLARSPFQSQGALPPGSPVFVGRSEELREILDGIQNDSFLIVGPRRIGKTSLLNQVLLGLQGRQGTRPLWLDCQGARRAEDLRPEISVLRSHPGNRKGDSRIGGLFQEVAWEAAGKGEQPVFLMNEIDGLVASDPAFIEELRSLANEAGARFVFTGYVAARQAAGEPQNALGWVRGFAGQPAFKLGPLEPAAARVLLTKLEGPELGVSWETAATREAGHARILERTYGIPWLLQETCNGLLRRLSESGAAWLRLEDVDLVTGESPTLLPLLEEEIHNFAVATDPEPASLAAQLILDVLAANVPGLAAGAVFTAETAADAVRRVASRNKDPRVWSRLVEYFAGFSIDRLLSGLAGSTLAIDRRYESGRFAGYSFTAGIYPQELIPATGGREGLEQRLSDGVTNLAAALRPETTFTTDPVDPADPESPRVAWRGGRAWRLEGDTRSAGSDLFTVDDLLSGRAVVVAGEARSGLRSFLLWVRWLAESSGRPFLFITLDGRAAQPGDERPLAEFLGQSLLEELRAALGGQEAARLDSEVASPGRLREILRWYGRRESKDRPLVLAVVGLDGLSPSALEPVISGLRASVADSSEPPCGTLILAASWQETLAPSELGSPFNVGERRRLPSLTTAEIAGLWERFGPGTAAPADLAVRCFAWTGGQPLLVQLFLREAARSGSDLEQIARRLVARPPEAVRLWQRDLASILRNDSSARRFLESILGGEEIRAPRSIDQLFNLGWIRPAESAGRTWSIRSQAHAEWARPVLANPGSFLPSSTPT